MNPVPPLHEAARHRLAHRAYHDADGSVRFTLHDGRAVRLTGAQWLDAQRRFAEAIRPADRMLTIGLNMAIPVFIATLWALLSFRLARSLDNAGPIVSIASGFFITAGGRTWC